MSYKTSVALCTFNGENYVEEQIDSILNQTVLPDEIVVSDDGSNDGTLEIVKKKLEKSLVKYKILVNRNNLGVIKNFENAIMSCEGDIIFTADQDDVWMEDKIEFVVKTFSSDEKLSIVFSDAFLVDENLSRTGTMLWDAVYPKINKLKTREEILKVLLKQNIMTGATMAFKRSIIENVIPFNNFWMHDYWIATIGTLVGEVEAIERPLILYRQHNNNVIGASKISFSKKINIYFKNLQRLDSIRKEKYNQFSLLKKFVSDNDLVINEIEKDLICENEKFWNKMIELKDKSKISAIKSIGREYFRGNYHKYFNGIRSAVRDIIGVILV